VSQPIDASAFRNALGNFATGITVVTTRDPASGECVGVTANSFNSVSLEPPLILWSIAKTARSRDAFSRAEHFAVNVLAADQVSLSNHFASRQPDKFAQLDFELGAGDVPLLEGCAARFQCRKVSEHEGGDHVILIGEVVQFDDTGRAGLLYHRGAYAVCEPHPVAAAPPAGVAPGGFVDHYLDYLLATAANRFQESFQPVLEAAGISRPAWRVLATLADRGALDLASLSATVLIPAEALAATTETMLAEGLLRRDEAGDRLALAAAAEDKAARLLAAAKAHELDALGEFSAEEAQALKTMLGRLIDWVDGAGMPAVSARKAAGG